MTTGLPKPIIGLDRGWVPDPRISPRVCGFCGHLHHGWRSTASPRLAPQWTWCDQHETCPCRTLIRAETP